MLGIKWHETMPNDPVSQSDPLCQFITADHFDSAELLLLVHVSSMVSRELYINSSEGLTAQKASS